MTVTLTEKNKDITPVAQREIQNKGISTQKLITNFLTSISLHE